MAADDTCNIEVQEAINKAIAARAALLTKQSEIMKGQVQIAIELADAFKGENLDGMRERLEEITAGIKAASEAADGASSSLTGLSAAAKAAAEAAAAEAAAVAAQEQEVEKVYKEFMGTMKKGMAVLGDAFASTGAMLDGVVGIIGSAARGITTMGMAILSIPLNIFSYLVDGASELMNGSTALREAFENVRETFGDLSKAEAKGVINSFDTLRDSAGSLGGSGLSLRKIFGHGQDGLAAALNALNETAAAMGPLFGVLQGQFEANADKLLVLQKGLGMSNEEMTALGSVAVATGGDMTQMMQEMGNLALQMGDKFGISSKLIGKDLAYMTANMGKFGSMTKTQMVTSSVYLRKLGLELKNIEGLMGAFDDFETAAGNAAKLAQGFGMTVDAFKMMKEQDPAKRLDMLRQAFAATGKSIESMSRQERAMLASSAGLDENMVSLALSSKNMGKSYDQIQKEAEKSNKKQLSQAEVMDKLADNIKRLTESMSSSGGFMERFFKGFEYGFKHSGPMMQLFRNLGQSLWKVEAIGRKVGESFANFFPGIKEMAGALADFFSPAQFQANLDKLSSLFETFFKDLSTDPVKATEKFVKSVEETFSGLFGGATGEGGLIDKLKEGFKKFATAFSGIAGFVGKKLIEVMTEAIKGFTEWLRNPKGLSKGSKEGVMGVLAPFLEQIQLALPDLKDALIDLLKVFAVKYGPTILKFVGTVFVFSLGKAIVGAMISAFITAMSEKLVKNILENGIKNVIRSGVRGTGNTLRSVATNIGSKITSVLPGPISRGFSSAASLISKFAGPIAIATAIASVGINVSKAADGYGKKLEKSFGKSASQAGILAGSVVDAITLGLLPGPVVEAIATFTASIKSGFDKFMRGIGLGGVVDYLDDSIDAIFDIFKGVGDILVGIFTGDSKKIQTGFMSLFEGIVEAGLGYIYRMPKLLLQAGPQVAVLLLKGLGMLLKGILVGASAILSGLIGGAIKMVKAAVQFWKDPNFREKSIQGIKDFGMNLFRGLISALDELIDWVPKWVAETFQAVKDAWDISSPSKKMMEIGSYLVDGIISVLTFFPNMMFDIMVKAWDLVTDFFGLEKTKALGHAIIDGFVSGLDTAKDVITAPFKAAWGGVKDFFGIKSPSKEATDVGAYIVDGMRNGILGVQTMMIDIFKQSLTNVIDVVRFSVNEIVSLFKDAFKNIVDLIKSSGIVELLGSVVGQAAKAVGSLLGSAFKASGMDIDISKIDKIIDAVSSLDVIDGAIKKVQNSLGSIQGYSQGQFGGIVNAIVEDIRAVNDALADLGDINVNATIDKLGDSLKLKTEVLNIERKPIQLNVSLNLTMKAEDITKEIFEVAAKLAKKEGVPGTEPIKQAFGV